MLHKPQGVVVYLSSLINSSPPSSFVLKETRLGSQLCGFSFFFKKRCEQYDPFNLRATFRGKPAVGSPGLIDAAKKAARTTQFPGYYRRHVRRSSQKRLQKSSLQGAHPGVSQIQRDSMITSTYTRLQRGSSSQQMVHLWRLAAIHL